jgi:hypothetical protein
MIMVLLRVRRAPKCRDRAEKANCIE